MRLTSHVSSTLKTVTLRSARPLRRPQWHRGALALALSRCASSSAAHPERIAILGGGIAGLASAYFTSKEFPNSEITLFESGKETGGWIKSRRVELPDGKNVLFELGPRTLRNATPTASLVQDLGMLDEILYTKRTEPAAKNRFLYFPDRLVRLPAELPSLESLFTLWRSGLLAGILNVLKEPLKPKRPSDMTDETLGSFLARRVDKRFADNIASAGLHGIYAGDVWQLSARTLLSMVWQLEARHGSWLGGYFKIQGEQPSDTVCTLAHPVDVEIAQAMKAEIDLDAHFEADLKNAAMYSFKDGLQSLVERLQNAVETKGNVVIKTESPIQSFKPLKDGQLGVEIVSGNTGDTTTSTFDLAISTLRDSSLTPYVTVMTVNLYFASPSLLPVEGFGYLIPQSVPFEQNPERALGVIFDSSAIKGQDTAPGTKVTVMMGGHWWDGWAGYPTEEEGLQMARSVLQRHLHIEEEPVAHIVNLSKDCIAQYTLGYEDRLKDFAHGITDEYKGRLRVVGSQFNGVGVNDCITGAWNVARGLRGDGWKSRSCGLDKVVDLRDWIVVPVKDMRYSNARIVPERPVDPMDKRGDGGV
ncbi:oxygen-dependent protoporphyrinogen oxidase [Coniothyrium glycines]